MGLVAAGQPETFQAAFGMEPGTVCVVEVHRRYTANGVVVQEQAWRAAVTFSRADGGGWIALCRRTLTEEAAERLRAAGLDPSGVEQAEPTLEFEFAPDGGVARLRNWEDVREQIRETAESQRLRLLHEGRMTLEEAFDNAAAVREATKSHDVVFDAQGLGFVPYLEGYGWTLLQGEPVVRAAYVPNLAGGSRAPAERTVEVCDDPGTVGLIEYRARDKIDQAALRESVGRVLEAGRAELERQLTEAGQEVPQDLGALLDGLEMTDSIEWVYSVELGGVVSARRVRELRGIGREDVEEVVWKWKPEEHGAEDE